MAAGMASVRDGELYYQLRGAGRPIVALHAGLLDHRIWDEQFELLAGNVTTIRYDAGGHGCSSATVEDFSHF